MADASELEDRLRKLEASHNALTDRFLALHSKVVAQQQRQEDQRLGPGIWVAIVTCYGLIAAAGVVGFLSIYAKG
jgi:hypothetical protein